MPVSVIDDGGLKRLIEEIRSCRICAPYLPHTPRPVLQAEPEARIMIVGQAPGTRVHATGIPWNDPSGDTLRAWLGLGREEFYDSRQIAIVPMGFCYPGKGSSGDLPPRRECAEIWRDKLHAQLPNIELTLLIGVYAQRYYLRSQAKKTVSETVRAWQVYWPAFAPMPHPSPRNRRWLKMNDWFESEHVPRLQKRVRDYLD